MCPRGVKFGVASADYLPQETNERQLRDDVIDSLVSPPEGIPGHPENQIWSSILQDNQQDAGCETLFFSLLVPACIHGNRATHKTSNTCWYIKRTGEHRTQSQTLFLHLLLIRWFIFGWNIQSAKHRVIINLYDQTDPRLVPLAIKKLSSWCQSTHNAGQGLLFAINHSNLLIIFSLQSFSDFFFWKT